MDCPSHQASVALPLVLPYPPPPPPLATAIPPARTGSFSSTATKPQAQAVPTIDDLLRETNNCRTLVSTISRELFTLETLRNEVISLGLNCPVTKLETVAGLVALVGRLILSLSAPLATVSNQVKVLADLAEKGQAAVLATEIIRIQEELETLKLEVKHNVEKVKRAAAEEYEARDSCLRRLEDRVRSENVGIGEDQVGRTCQGAMNGLGMQIDLVELDTYAGRVCLENPFTSLALLIEDAANVHRKQQQIDETLSRQGTRTSFATTLVGSSSSQYGKDELGEDGDGQERQPLAGAAFAAAELGEIEKNGDPKLSRLQKLKLRWREYLIRVCLFFAVVGTLVAIIMLQTFQQAKAEAASQSSMSLASAKLAATGVPDVL